MKKFIDYDFQTIEAEKKQLHMTETQINREYLIKVKGNGYNTLVGVAGLLALVGVEKANKMLDRANKCLGDVCRCAVYGTGLQVSFYIH